MRTYWLIGLAAIAFTATGCTGHQLRRSTVSQASTLTDLQYQLVLDNLAMFAANPSALPWHVNLKNGSSQVADSGAASLVGSWGTMMSRLATGTPGVNGSRTIVEQWGNVPITEDHSLRLLQIAYRRALGFPDKLDDEDFANDLAHELKKQVTVSDDYKDIIQNTYDNKEINSEADGVATDLNQLGFPIPSYQILRAFLLASNDDRIILKDERVSAPDGDKFIYSRTNPRPVGDLLNLSDQDKKLIADGAKTMMVPDPTLQMYGQIPTAVIQEVRRQVKETADDIDKIHPRWFGVGCKKEDIPPDACYIGHYKDRCGERYVWVCAAQRQELARFTLTILSLGGLLQDRQLIGVPGGPAYAPSSAYLH